MIRNLLSSIIPMNPNQIITIMGSGASPVLLEMMWLFFMMTNVIISSLVVVVTQFPKDHVLRRKWVPAFCGLGGDADYYGARTLLVFLMQQHMSLPINYVFATVSFYHVGALVGSMFYAGIAKKSRKYALVAAQILSIGVLVAFSVFCTAVLIKKLPIEERSYLIDGHTGARKIRSLVLPNLVKDLGGNLGFDGAFSLDFQRCTLIVVFLGFAGCVNAVSMTSILDTCKGSDFLLMLCMAWYGFILYGFNLFLGGGMAWLGFMMFDIDGALIMFAVFKGIAAILIMVEMLESKDYDRGWDPDETKCFVKALYYAVYLCPQGGFQDTTTNLIGHMLDMRYGINYCSAGWVSGYRQRFGRLAVCLIIMGLIYLHMPVIGIMFWCAFAGGGNHLLYASLSGDLLQVHDFINLEGSMTMWAALYPAFVASWVKREDMPIILGTCVSMWHFGNFMAIGRWPTQLGCGDPMNCWRGQYLYSHAIFYNSGGDSGNISYVNWYLFAKSQRRQCCCPYRKLKQEAPDRCCPPCCLGPLVEDTGGCPCPCFSASCAT